MRPCKARPDPLSDQVSARHSARAPRKTVKRFRLDLRCDAYQLTMSTTMTPQAHVAALNALHLSIRIQANKLAGVLSTPHSGIDAC